VLVNRTTAHFACRIAQIQ